MTLSFRENQKKNLAAIFQDRARSTSLIYVDFTCRSAGNRVAELVEKIFYNVSLQVLLPAKPNDQTRKIYEVSKQYLFSSNKFIFKKIYQNKYQQYILKFHISKTQYTRADCYTGCTVICVTHLADEFLRSKQKKKFMSLCSKIVSLWRHRRPNLEHQNRFFFAELVFLEIS